MDTLKTIQKYYRQRELAAREWKKKGGKVIGYFCTNIPEELILAAGFFPFRLSGNPNASTEAADKYVEPYYEPNIRSMFDMLLTGRYDFLDFLIIPHSRDSVTALYNYLTKIKVIEPELKLPELYLFDIPRNNSWLSDLYYRDRLGDFKKTLEQWSGKKISEQSLYEAITIVNENRMLLKKVAGLRAINPPSISGVEALQIIGSSMFVHKEEHNKLLKKYLETSVQFPAKEGTRLFVAGSPLDNLQLYETIETCNAVIVGEDNCWGNRYSDIPIDTSLEPLEAIANRYNLNPACPLMHSVAEAVDYCVKTVDNNKARGVIFFLLEYDNSPCWDYPDQKNALEKKGIPTLCLNAQKYLLSDTEKKKITLEIRQFLKNIEMKEVTNG